MLDDRMNTAAPLAPVDVQRRSNAARINATRNADQRGLPVKLAAVRGEAPAFLPERDCAAARNGLEPN